MFGGLILGSDVCCYRVHNLLGLGDLVMRLMVLVIRDSALFSVKYKKSALKTGALLSQHFQR
jgi:hypothetical protein